MSRSTCGPLSCMSCMAVHGRIAPVLEAVGVRVATGVAVAWRLRVLRIYGSDFTKRTQDMDNVHKKLRAYDTRIQYFTRSARTLAAPTRYGAGATA